MQAASGNNMHHLQSESPVCADLPRSVCAVQQDSGRLHGSERLRWEGMGMSGLFTTRRPGCTPCSASSLQRGVFCDAQEGSSEGVNTFRTMGEAVCWLL